MTLVGTMTIEFSPAQIGQYRNVAISAARRTGLDIQAAEDVAQESVIQLFRYRNRVASEQAVDSWLRTTATRRATKQLSSSRDLGLIEEFPERLGVEEAIVDDLERERVHDRIMALMAELPKAQRQLIDVLFFEDMSYEEAAERLGMAMGSIGPTRKRALARLLSAWRRH